MNNKLNGPIAQKNIDQDAICIINNNKQLLDSCSSLYRPDKGSVVIPDINATSSSSFIEGSTDKNTNRGHTGIKWARLTLFEPVPNQFSMNLYLNYDLVKNKPRTRLTFSFRSTRLRDFLPRGHLEHYRNDPFYRTFIDGIKEFGSDLNNEFVVKPRASKAYLSGSKTPGGGTTTVKYTAAAIYKMKGSTNFEVVVSIGGNKTNWNHQFQLEQDNLSDRQKEAYAIGECIYRAETKNQEWIDVDDLL